MKNFRFLFSIGSLLSALLFLACNGKQVTEVNAAQSTLDGVELASNTITFPQGATPVAFSEVASSTHDHINNLVKSYDQIKDALVNAKFEEAKAASEKIVSEIKDFNSKKDLNEEQDEMYLKVGAKLKNNAERIQKSKDLKEQRTHFSALTSDLYRLIKAFGGNEQDLYYQYCPMAFNDKGGYWLSLDEEIENPYFGDKMLRCGVVRETIEKE
ncbi:DUF3347 domain-containing protein [soil metagenome]